MLFNSLSFLAFLPIVFILHWFLFKKNKVSQNILLLIASFYFYSCWNWKFLFLLIFSIVINYFSAFLLDSLQSQEKKRKIILIIALVANIGVLMFFKYFNFFIESFQLFLAGIGINQTFHTLNIILPVGISFYTFHGLSYILDVYNKKIKKTDNLLEYSLFVSYFPLLVAGPIERASHLLPQLEVKRKFSYEMAVDGLRQILWGLFKKVAVADYCATYANSIFESYTDMNSFTLFIGGALFAIQIYCDFSGYSDIALGTSKLFGINLLKNFNYPYFSRNIAEFWRRWHISLSSWFKDYLYIPLGGSKGGMWMRIRNTFIIFIVSGFWHGANWTFIAWGALNALFIMPSIILKTNRNSMEIVAKDRFLPSIKEALQMLVTFILCIFAWIVFRSNSIYEAYDYIRNIFVKAADFSLSLNIHIPLTTYPIIATLFVIEWLGRRKNFALENLGAKFPMAISWTFYLALIYLICMNMRIGSQEFIYFQF